MSYIINNYTGVQLTTIQDGTVDNTLDLKLIGKDVPNYGEIQNENYVFLLENFAGQSSPPRPIRGQIWYDSASKALRIFDGSAWKVVGGVTPANSAPSGASTGDLWYDIINKQLSVWNGAKYVLVGPQLVPGKGDTLFSSRAAAEAQSGIEHAVIEGYVNGEPIAIISSDEFTLSTADISKYYNNFTSLKRGINLADTNQDGVSSVFKFWGTASDSDRLGGKLATDYVLASSLQFNEASIGGLLIHVVNSTPTIQNVVGDSIIFKTSATTTPLILDNDTILPGNTVASTDIGSDNSKFGTVYAKTFNGVSTKSDSLKVGVSYYSTSLSATNNTIVARDGSGNITANIFDGVATSARFADLAEKYLTDQNYPTGTVVMVGGDLEVTMAVLGHRAIGVISEYPGYMMNCDLDGGQYVALKGRVPVKVIGAVKKGDELSAHNNGTAYSSSTKVFAIALQDSDNEDVKLVEALIL